MITNQSIDPMFDVPELVALPGVYAPPERSLDPGVSPLLGSLAGRPPLYSFRSAASRRCAMHPPGRAARAHAADATVDVETREHQGHVFHALPLPQGGTALERIAPFIEVHAGRYS
jgi:hypothetical protein